jgi:hypothetical protein
VIRQHGPDKDARLISTDELMEIRRLWRTEEQDWEDSVPAIYREETGQEIGHTVDDSSNAHEITSPFVDTRLTACPAGRAFGAVNRRAARWARG